LREREAARILADMKKAPLRLLFSAALATFALVATALPASALPSETPDGGVYMVNGPRVDDVAQVGQNTWLGGAFTQIQNASGSNVDAVDGLAVLDADGVENTAIQHALPALNGSNVDVYDLSLSPSGMLYAAGTFSYSCGTKTCKNLIGIDPTTGAVVGRYIAPALRAVVATGDFVYAGGRKLQRYPLLSVTAAKADGTWHQLTTYIDGSLRPHTTNPQIRAIDVADASRLIVVGQFDWIDGTDAAHEKKVAVMVDTATGTPDIAANGGPNWTVNCDCARQTSSAFGLAVDVDAGVAYIGAGGNDWAGAFTISNGSKLWQTDANGSVQDLTVYDESRVILGGHFTSVEITGATDDGGSECPARTAADQAPCMPQPRLAAVIRTGTDAGLADQSWHPVVCCLYRGVWATTVAGTTLHVGGEFTKLGDDKHNFYGRFSVAPVP
jgi:hypothetical protein